MSGTERKFATNWSGNIAAVKIFWMGAMTDSGAKMTTVSGFVDNGSHLLVLWSYPVVLVYFQTQ